MMPYGLFRKWRRSQQRNTKTPAGQVRSVIRLQVEQLEPRELLSATTAAALTNTLASAGALASQDTSAANLLSVLGAAPTGLSPATVGMIGPNDPSAASPTGRNPRLLWNPQQQAIWNQLVQENSPWWQLVQHHAERTPFADHGAWATLAYQMTGDPTYAAKAWSLIQPLISHDPLNSNFLRENFEQMAISFDWLLPALTPTQRQQYVNGLNRWSNWALSNFRLGDTDQTISQYFGLAMVDIATQGYSRMAGSWLNQSANGRSSMPMGGLVATAADRSTVRNAISQYVQMAAGGVWVESSQYNLNTLQLLTLGVEAIDSATHQDSFPEVTQFLKQAALAEMYEMAPTLKDSYQWGDNEHPRNSQLGKRMGLLGMLAGATQNDPSVGPYINQFVQNLADKFGYLGWQSAAPQYPWMFYLYNPNAAKADWTQALPAGYFASGRGTLYFHNGWSGNSSFFGAQFPPPSNADHQVSFFGDFQLYSQGGWAVTHPIGYGNVADSGVAGNDMLIAGFSSMQDRHVDAQQFGPNGSYAYVSGTTRGSNYASGYYNPPPNFLQEWTRSLFYLPSANGGPDTVIVFDRVNANDPTKLPNFSRYTTDDQQTIKSAPALDQWLIHSNVKPTATANGFSWKAANGQQVQVTTLLPAQHTVTSYSEQQVLGPSNNFVARELKGYQTRISPVSTSSWQTFLNVVQSGAKGTVFNDALVKADDDSAEGTLVHRAGQSDTLVLFGAVRAGRLLEQGYTVHYSANTANSQVNVTDLDPRKHWTVSINRGPAQQLSVSSQGVASFTVQGAGADSFKIAVAR